MDMVYKAVYLIHGINIVFYRKPYIKIDFTYLKSTINGDVIND